MVLHTFSWYSSMGPKYNFDSKRKIPQEDEVESVEGRFHKDMDEKDEFIKFVRNMLKGMQEILSNIIQSSQETKEFLTKQLGAKDGDGSNIGSQPKDMKIMGGFIFSKTRPHNRPLEFKYEPNLHPWLTIPKFMEYPKEDHEVQTKTLSLWE